MIPVDAILFDLDGTLIDSKRDLAQSVRYLQRQYGAAVSSDQQVGSFIGDGVMKLIQRALPKLPEVQLDQAVTVFKNYYREHCLDHTHVYPGVLTTLKHFRQKKIAVVTNKPVRVSGYLLDELGISSYIEILIGGDSLPNKKPHPEPVLSALKTMRIRGLKRSVIVGDGPNDILAGQAAGIYTCGIKSNIGNLAELSRNKPDFIIQGMKDLMRIFN